MSAITPSMYWRTIKGDDVRCELCYRRCELTPGEAGFCKIRANDGGKLALTQHGVVAVMAPRTHQHFNFHNDAWVATVAGVSCTSRCTFCTSCDLALNHDRLDWIPPEQLQLDNPRYWWGHGRVRLPATGVIERAKFWGCAGVYFTANEPTLSIEYTLEVARLAKQAGLFTSMDTNGFTSPQAIADLAPWIDHVHIGGKGHLHPDFYAKRMRAPGAVPHVYRAMQAWRDAGTHMMLSDLVTPPHWLTDDAEAERQMRAYYSWIADELGDVGLHLRPMLLPGTRVVTRLLPRNATADDVARYDARFDLAARVARECGLRNLDLLIRSYFGRTSR